MVLPLEPYVHEIHIYIYTHIIYIYVCVCVFVYAYVLYTGFFFGYNMLVDAHTSTIGTCTSTVHVRWTLVDSNDNVGIIFFHYSLTADEYFTEVPEKFQQVAQSWEAPTTA